MSRVSSAHARLLYGITGWLCAHSQYALVLRLRAHYMSALLHDGRSASVTLTAAALPASCFPPSSRQRAAGPPSPQAPTAPPAGPLPNIHPRGQVGNQGYRLLDQLSDCERVVFTKTADLFQQLFYREP